MVHRPRRRRAAKGYCYLHEEQQSPAIDRRLHAQRCAAHGGEFCQVAGPCSVGNSWHLSIECLGARNPRRDVRSGSIRDWLEPAAGPAMSVVPRKRWLNRAMARTNSTAPQ